jgi:hypothetical protein
LSGAFSFWRREVPMPVKSVHEINPCGGEEGDNDGRREDTVRKSEYEFYVE